MRLHEVERGDSPFWGLVIRLISLMSGMRLPDAARAVFYHKAFFGDLMSFWTHAAMRGESAWTVGERELMAAMTAKWNACSFCIGAHGAIAARVLGKPLVETALNDFRQAELPTKLQATLTFLEILTRRPDQPTAEDARAVLREGVTPDALEDAIAVTILFNITSRCADALSYAMLDDRGFDSAAKRLLVQGYAFGKGKTPAHPDHRALADTVRRRAYEGPGKTDAALRQAMAERAAGGPPLGAPYDDLTRQIGEAAYKVTDEQVAKVVEDVGSEKAAFELIVASALGAGLHRWRWGLKVLEEAIL
ncbi:MAG: carboxymuconolactone decarboxylase family protein [Roseiflexaceae bacterium]